MDACLWDRCPLVSYLSWPWALSRDVTQGQVRSTQLQEVTEALVVKRDVDISPTVFEVPAGFVVRGAR